MSAIRIRMQPMEAGVPIASANGVPWM